MNSIMLPPARPGASSQAVLAHLERLLDADPAFHIGGLPVVALAIRGYYRDTMGAPGRNDVGIFDDACFLIDRRTGAVKSFNWNTDPSRLGFNASIDKPFAILAAGSWIFRKGRHKGKGEAWRQLTPEEAQAHHLGKYYAAGDPRADGRFKVWRGQLDQKPEQGYQAINIHWGGESTTSSWGCQTAPPSQWGEFQRLSYKLTGEEQLLPYLLTSEQIPS